MEISCKEVTRELSTFIDKALESELRQQIEEHLAKCRHCSAIYDGTRNIIHLVGDGRTFELPAGFSRRLRQRLAKEASGSR
jgi:predicted anti-sigma-YlaC factor YlaD